MGKVRSELNEREIAVFRYLGEGKRDADIAMLLSSDVGEEVTQNTVRLLLRRGMQRLGAETRCHAIKLLCEQGFYNKGPT